MPLLCVFFNFFKIYFILFIYLFIAFLDVLCYFSATGAKRFLNVQFFLGLAAFFWNVSACSSAASTLIYAPLFTDLCAVSFLLKRQTSEDVWLYAVRGMILTTNLKFLIIFLKCELGE